MPSTYAPATGIMVPGMVQMFGPMSGSAHGPPGFETAAEWQQDEVVYFGNDVGSSGSVGPFGDSRFRVRKNIGVSKTSLKFRKILN